MLSLRFWPSLYLIGNVGVVVANFLNVQVLNVPRSDVEVIRGGKGRDKVLQIRDWKGVDSGAEGESKVSQAVQEMLEKACDKD